jgi:hypothetical protein
MIFGGIVTLAVLAPNLLFLIYPPRPSGPARTDVPAVGRWIEILERVGQATCFVLPFFYQIDVQRPLAIPLLGVLILMLIIYYTGWARYLIQRRDTFMMFKPLLGIPLPMALAPVICFFAAAVLFSSLWLGAAAVCLAVGHLAVSYHEYLKWR